MRNAPLTAAQRRALISILRAHPKRKRRKAHKRRTHAKRKRRNPKRRTASGLRRHISPSSAGARLAFKRWRGNPYAKGKVRRYTGSRRVGTVFRRKHRRYIITRLRNGVRVTRPWAVRRRR